MASTTVMWKFPEEVLPRPSQRSCNLGFYWDYYQDSEEKYNRISAITKISVSAGGAWKWIGTPQPFQPSVAIEVIKPVIGINRVIVTEFGDNGGACPVFYPTQLANHSATAITSTVCLLASRPATQVYPVEDFYAD